MITIKNLKEMKPGIFATGIIKDDRIHREFTVRWVASRGFIHDWAIYYHKEEHDEIYVKEQGDKMTTEAVIRFLVPCDDEAFKMYRY